MQPRREFSAPAQRIGSPRQPEPALTHCAYTPSTGSEEPGHHTETPWTKRGKEKRGKTTVSMAKHATPS